MRLINIDQKKCRQDGLCAADCPTGVIRLEDGNGYPELIADGESMCLRCGHCVAVCPQGALDHADVPLASCVDIDKALTLSQKQAEQFLRSRRSIRQFKKQSVDPVVLQRLIEIARYAPSGSNLQSVQWVVINDKTCLRTLSEQVIEWMRRILASDPRPAAMPYLPMLMEAWDAGHDAVLRGAPCLVVAVAPATSRNGMVDLTLALAYLELAAPVFGLGTCWAGLLQGAILSNPALKEVVGIADEYPHHYPMMIGYPNVKYHRLPERKAPKITWK